MTNLNATLPALAFLLALTAAATPGGADSLADANADATITLVVDSSAYPFFPDSKTCTITVPEGSTGAIMLTLATASGCIAGWTGSPSACCGIFVDGVDGRRAVCDTPVWLVHCTFWFLEVNGAPSETGIDGWSAQDGDSYGFIYTRAYEVHPLLP